MLFRESFTPQYAPNFCGAFYVFLREIYLPTIGILANKLAMLDKIHTYIPIIGADLAPKKMSSE